MSAVRKSRLFARLAIRTSLSLMACALIAASAPALARRGGGAVSTLNPFNLPLLTTAQANSMFTFLGSFSTGGQFPYGGGGTSVSGTTMYMYGYPASVSGIGSMTIPTLSGTPTYVSPYNGTATVVVTPSSIGPFANFGSAGAITGSMVYNGNLIVTGGARYDAACNETTGWAALTPASSPGSSWGSLNSVSLSALFSSAVPANRFMAGPLGMVPAIWQPYFGTAYMTAGEGLSIASCGISQGPSFVSFNPSSITQAGAQVAGTVGLGYTTNASQQLTGVAYSGPFPLTTTTGYYPINLSSSSPPVAGDTSVSIALPTQTVTVTANFSNSTANNNLTVTAVDSGTISDSGISYSLSDSGNLLTGLTTMPAMSAPPGATLGAATYITSNLINNTASGDTVTMTPDGYQTDVEAWEMFFSDGEIRLGTISGSTFTFITAQVCTASACQTLTASPLTCSPSCSTTAQIAPMGDAFSTDYDGPVGYGFFVPGTRTFVALEAHKSGPNFGRMTSACDPNAEASNSYEYPLAPDTKAYEELLLYLYDAHDIYNAQHGLINPYSVRPYAVVGFYDNANLQDANGCLDIGAYRNGWAYFDQDNDDLYLNRQIGTNGTVIDDTYHLTAP